MVIESSAAHPTYEREALVRAPPHNGHIQGRSASRPPHVPSGLRLAPVSPGISVVMCVEACGPGWPCGTAVQCWSCAASLRDGWRCCRERVKHPLVPPPSPRAWQETPGRDPALRPGPRSVCPAAGPHGGHPEGPEATPGDLRLSPARA